MRAPFALSVATLVALAGRGLASPPASSAVPVGDAVGLIATDGAGLENRSEVGVRIDLDYLRAPLRLPVEGALATMVDHEVSLRVGLFLGIHKRITVGVAVPVTFAHYTEAGAAAATGAGHVTGSDVAQGDLRLLAKISLVRARLAALALVMGLVAPTGDTAGFRGDGSFALEPRLAFELGGARAALLVNLGARLHGVIEAPSGLAIGPEIAWAVGVRVSPVPSLGLAIEGAGSETAPALASTRTLELIGSATVRPAAGVAVFFGIGRSLALDAARGDEVRLFTGIAWHPGGALPPVAPVVAPAPPPVQAPAPAPAPPPDPDRDGDGLSDARDRCPDEVEDKDGFQDDDGCPDPDNDGDGVLDRDDRCPDEPETKNGFEDEDGCPDTSSRVIVTHNGPQEPKIILHFAKGSAAIDPEGRSGLDRVAEVLAAHPEILRVRVEGHADREGSDRKTAELSQKRADAARKYLIEKGILAERLEAVGYGSTRPIVPLGRPENRRVELTVLDP